MLSEASVLRRWNEYFENDEPMNLENNRERKMDGGQLVNQAVQRMVQALVQMTSLWRCRDV